jgi:hypothetical protein
MARDVLHDRDGALAYQRLGRRSECYSGVMKEAVKR